MRGEQRLAEKQREMDESAPGGKLHSSEQGAPAEKVSMKKS